MTPDQFLSRLKRQEIASAYLFLGPESYQRRRCREALIAAVIPEGDRESAVTRYDLNETPLVEALDDARALSLFSPRRVIVAANAEAALPRLKSEEDDAGTASGGREQLAAYLKNPSPGLVLWFDAPRYDFEGEDKKRLDRVRKFYAAVPETVELRRYSMDDARAEAHALVRRAGVSMEPAALDLLVEALGGDVGRIAIEVEKLSLYAGKTGRSISVDDVSTLAPDARATTIFVLVGALGRRDRTRGLQTLDTLCREGEYLPLALSFLSTQFRMALAAKEAGLRSAQQILGHFSRSGAPMWPSRAEQIHQTMSRFSKERLEKGLQLIFAADRDLRSARPDDRIVMERFVVELTR